MKFGGVCEGGWVSRTPSKEEDGREKGRMLYYDMKALSTLDGL